MTFEFKLELTSHLYKFVESFLCEFNGHALQGENLVTRPQNTNTSSYVRAKFQGGGGEREIPGSSRSVCIPIYMYHNLEHYYNYVPCECKPRLREEPGSDYIERREVIYVNNTHTHYT